MTPASGDFYAVLPQAGMRIKVLIQSIPRVRPRHFTENAREKVRQELLQ